MKSQDLNRQLLFIACIFLPFTSLRIGFLGVGELLICAVFFNCYIKKYNCLAISGVGKLAINFWFLYIFIIALAFIYNLAFLRYFSGTFEGALYDIAAYFFIFLSLLILNRLIDKSTGALFIYKIYKTWFIILFILYILSLYFNQILGFKLRHPESGAFMPLVENVHQLSMITCVLPFIGIALLRIYKNKKDIFFLIICLAFFSLIAIQSQSTKAIIGVLFGFFVYLISSLIYKINPDKNRLINIIIILITIGVFASVFFSNSNLFILLAVNFFKESDPQDARAYLWSEAIYHGWNSYLIGFGPGPHIFKDGKFWDAHMSFLTSYLQGGLIGLLLLIYFFYRVVRKLMPYPELLASFSAIFIYAFGGDILRRLPIWVIIFFILFLSNIFSTKKHYKYF